MTNKAILRLVLVSMILLAVVGLSLPRVSLGLGGQWVEIGTGAASGSGVSATTAQTGNPAIAVGLDRSLVIAWSDKSDGDAEIYVKQWREGVWQEVGSHSATGGGISDNNGSSESPSAAIGTNGVIYVAWEDDSSGHKEIYVRRFIDGAWAEINGSASKGGISKTSGESRSPSLYLGPEDLPYIAWEEAGSDDSEIYVRRWNANAWGEVGTGSASGGGISNNSGDSTLPTLAVDDNGDAFVAWADKSGGDTEIYVRHFAGSSWAELGAGSASGGGISDNAGTSRNPNLALAGDGTVYVAWSDDSSGNYEIYVRRWDGAWNEIGAGSAAGGGVSQTTRHSHAPRIAVDPAGRPSVVWYQATAADAEIYLRRWDGALWAELGGSGSGGGLSDNSGASAHPALAAYGQSLVVAWDDNSPGQYAIYARQWVEGDEPTATATATVTTTATASATATATSTGTTTYTATATSTSTTTYTPTPTITTTAVASTTPTVTPAATPTATSVGATATRTLTATATPTATIVPAGTPPPHYLPVVLNQLLSTPTSTATNTPTSTVTATSTSTPTMTVTPTQTPIPTTTATATATMQPIDELLNGDFEQGHNGAWTELSGQGYSIITNLYPSGVSAHSGLWISWLGGVLNDTKAIQQIVTVPTDRAYLRYWHWIASADICNYDIAGVVINGDDAVDAFWLCNAAATNGWRVRTLDLRAYAGQSVELTFLSDTDSSLNSNWFVDDIAFVRTAATAATDNTGRVTDIGVIERLEDVLDQMPNTSQK